MGNLCEHRVARYWVCVRCFPSLKMNKTYMTSLHGQWLRMCIGNVEYHHAVLLFVGFRHLVRNAQVVVVICFTPDVLEK